MTDKEGHLTEDKAWEIWFGLESGDHHTRVRIALEKGEITEEEAKQKWAALDKEN